MECNTDKKMNTYRLRAECVSDLKQLSIAFVSAGVVATLGAAQQDDQFPDAEVDLETTLSLEEIRAMISKIPDGHVMLETVQALNEYDGVRRPIEA